MFVYLHKKSGVGMDTIDRILELLEEKGVSGAEMSRQCGFSNAVFSQWKNKKQNPSAEKVSKMAEYFNVSVDYLLGITDIKKEKPRVRSDEELDREFATLYNQLSKEQRDMIKAQIKGLLSNL